MADDTPAPISASSLSSLAKALALQPPPELVAVLTALDARPSGFDVREVYRELRRAVPDHQALSAEMRRGAWAEEEAFALGTQRAGGDGHIGTYFRSPDFAAIDAEVLAYWAARAKASKHPVLVARYADLVWDLTPVVAKSKRTRDLIEYAQLAIDNYTAASRIDEGALRGEMRGNLARALNLALSVRQEPRIDAVVKALIEYVDRTAEDERVGTYAYLFDILLPPKKGPKLNKQQEESIIQRFEDRFARMTKPGGEWDVEPHTPKGIGDRLARYYERKGRERERKRVLKAIARQFERRADMGDPLSGVIFLDDARKLYVEAGLPKEAERVQRKSEELAPTAGKRMGRISIEHETSVADRDSFLAALVADGLEAGILRFTRCFIIRQDRLKKEVAELAMRYPLQALFTPTVLGPLGVGTQIGDTRGDPDGPMVFETARRLQFSSVQLSWALDHLIGHGLTAEHLTEFVAKSPVFSSDRIPLIQRGIQAHLLGDYIQAIHLLIPQIERGIVGLTYLSGGTSSKPHRSGRAVMQAKSLQNALDDKAVRKGLGPDLTMYLMASLSHQKGLNIRNEVCHGLWAPSEFSKSMSERVLHVLLTLSLLRNAEKKQKSTPSTKSGGDASREVARKPRRGLTHEKSSLSKPERKRTKRRRT